MLVEAQPSVVAPPPGRVLRGREADIPLPQQVCLVASGLHLLRHAGHVPRDALESRDVVVGVPTDDVPVHYVHVHCKPAALQRGARGRADLVGVVLVEQQAVINEPVQVRRVDFRLRLLPGTHVFDVLLVPSVVAKVAPAVVVREEEHDVGFRRLWVGPPLTRGRLQRFKCRLPGTGRALEKAGVLAVERRGPAGAGGAFALRGLSSGAHPREAALRAKGIEPERGADPGGERLRPAHGCDWDEDRDPHVTPRARDASSCVRA
mmetsp:Transcript_23661/g.74371  ORF Transcript_23661/g.74371 Transcript_23661/m.74371 type:complete len:263 (-) Transcript_23661:12-800(-)